MQGTWTNRKKCLTSIIITFIILVLVLLDQLLKLIFVKLNNQNDLLIHPIIVINNFFYFSFVLNSGSAYGFLSNVSWGQTLFKILTPLAVIAFVLLLIFALKRNYKTFSFGLVFIIGGTLGNFCDRIINGKVVDYICLEIGGKRIFGVFNLADVFLTVGVILLLVHFLFLDKNAIFGKKNDRKID